MKIALSYMFSLCFADLIGFNRLGNNLHSRKIYELIETIETDYFAQIFRYADIGIRRSILKFLKETSKKTKSRKSKSKPRRYRKIMKSYL